jgi:hypothetical protein
MAACFVYRVQFLADHKQTTTAARVCHVSNHCLVRLYIANAFMSSTEIPSASDSNAATRSRLS